MATHSYITNKPLKYFTQPQELFEAVNFLDMGVIKESDKYIPRFVEGEKYSLQGVACDGFKMKEKVYELVGVIDEYKGTKIDSVIVKQISGDKHHIFTLSKNDCKHLNIKYESGLQLFPKNLPWRRVKDEIPFDKNNLGTTPLSNIDNTIRYVLVKLNGFEDYYDGYVLTPSGHLVTEKQFESTLRITTVEPLVYGNGYVYQSNNNLDIEIVYPKGLLYNHANFISSENTIYVLIKLVRPRFNADDDSLIDGFFGVEQPYLNGVNPNEYFKISWDEYNAKTIDEYESHKEWQKQQAELIEAQKQAEIEKANKEKEEAKKRLQKRVEDAVNRMNNYNNYRFKIRSITPSTPSSSLQLAFDELDYTIKEIFKQQNELFNNNFKDITRL